MVVQGGGQSDVGAGGTDVTGGHYWVPGIKQSKKTRRYKQICHILQILVLMLSISIRLTEALEETGAV